jgi:hypothetical protein
LPIAQIVSIMTMIAMNCSRTRKPHQLLRFVRRAAARHVGEAEDQHHRDGTDRDRHKGKSQDFGHWATLLTPSRW